MYCMLEKCFLKNYSTLLGNIQSDGGKTVSGKISCNQVRLPAVSARPRKHSLQL